METKGEKAVIDIDLRWAANAEFVVEAGVKPVPLMVTLNKICFSGRLRVELAPLVPVVRTNIQYLVLLDTLQSTGVAMRSKSSYM